MVTTIDSCQPWDDHPRVGIGTGGGTMTAYLGAVDDRVTAAVSLLSGHKIRCEGIVDLQPLQNSRCMFGPFHQIYSDFSCWPVQNQCFMSLGRHVTGQGCQRQREASLFERNLVDYWLYGLPRWIKLGALEYPSLFLIQYRLPWVFGIWQIESFAILAAEGCGMLLLNTRYSPWVLLLRAAIPNASVSRKEATRSPALKKRSETEMSAACNSSFRQRVDRRHLSAPQLWNQDPQRCSTCPPLTDIIYMYI